MSKAPSDVASKTAGLADDPTIAVPRVSIDWQRSWPWWRLLSQTVSIAWRASHLMVAALGWGLIGFGWWLGSRLFGVDDPIGGFGQAGWRPPIGEREILSGQVFSLGDLAGGGMQWLSQALSQPWTLQRAAFLVFGLCWTIGLWSLVGGVLARRSLMEFGIRTSVGWGPTLQLVLQRWRSMVWAIGMPLMAVVGLCLIPWLWGMLSRAGFIGSWIGLLLMIPTIFLAIGIGWCGVISWLGFPLMICAILAEKRADAFDGVSRAAAYVFQRPMTVLVILFLASGLAGLGQQVIRWVLEFGEQALWQAFAIGYGGSVESLVEKHGAWSEAFYGASRQIIVGLQSAFVISFFWSAAAAGYLTLRYEIDQTDFDELDLQELGEPLPLPAFREDARGVSEMVPPPGSEPPRGEANEDRQTGPSTSA
jgi:hypothetical protein